MTERDHGGAAADPPVRVELPEATPGVYRALVAFDRASRAKLDPAVAELVRIRASQLNGCAFCIDMHTKDARAAGESEQRIYALPAWREAPFYTDRERVALALTDALTLVAGGHVPDAVYAEAARWYDEAELAHLIWTIVAINAWNRVAIATRPAVGAYQPRPPSGVAPAG